MERCAPAYRQLGLELLAVNSMKQKIRIIIVPMDLGFFDVPSSEALDFIDSFAGVTVTNLNKLSGVL